MPLLVGTDGVEKMSKSYNNYIGISDPPGEIFGKTLSIPDDLIYTYFELAADISNEELAQIKKQLTDPSVNPRNIKRQLAKTLVKMYYDESSAAEAEAEFDKIFIKKEIPDDIPEYLLNDNKEDAPLIDLIMQVGFAPSRQEARRLITQGGVYVNSEKIEDLSASIKLDKEVILKVGKRKFIKIKRT
jgi:tyrosyl-tRNA synthetase